MRFRNAMSLVNAALALALAATSTFFPAEATALPPEQTQTSTDVAVGSPTIASSAGVIDPLVTPLSVSLQQSTFDPAATAAGLVVTVTVRNNLGPVVAPPIVAGEDITTTIAALRSVSVSQHAAATERAASGMRDSGPFPGAPRSTSGRCSRFRDPLRRARISVARAAIDPRSLRSGPGGSAPPSITTMFSSPSSSSANANDPPDSMCSSQGGYWLDSSATPSA